MPISKTPPASASASAAAFSHALSCGATASLVSKSIGARPNWPEIVRAPCGSSRRRSGAERRRCRTQS
eukprot:8484151-Alexandrium_andersonii.AAC.1